MGLRGPGAKPKTKGTKRPICQKKADLPKSDKTRIDAVVDFVERCPITAGTLAGERFRLRPWQRDIVSGIYRTDADGRRIVRTALITMPRKNGKTGLTAPLALAHLCGPEAEPRGQVYAAAADRGQSGIIFAEMRAIIQQVPELEERVIIRDFSKSMEDTVTGTTFQAISAESRTKHGFSASCIIVDELAQLPDRKLYDVLTTSTAARKEPLTIVISTQSPDQHHVMTELVNYGIQVRDGVIEDPTFFPVIYSAPLDADPWSEDTWRACNPAYGDFRSADEMRTYAARAQRIPALEATFRLLYLNQPVSAEARFITRADWEACGASIDPASLRGKRCWGGLDLSSTQDLTALVLYFETGDVLAWFWVPAERLDEREKTDRVPFRTWQRAGHIEAPNGRAIDRLAIVRRIAEITASYDLQGIAYDRWRIEDLLKLCGDEGIDVPLVKWGQGFADMGPAVDALESAILNGTLRHPRNPVLTWNVSNAVVEIDPAGARKLSKSKSVERIDGLQALTMAVGLHARTPGPIQYDFSQGMVISA